MKTDSSFNYKACKIKFNYDCRENNKIFLALKYSVRESRVSAK